MKSISITQGYSVLVDDDKYEWLSSFKWYACRKRNGDGSVIYATRDIFIDRKRIKISMHRQIMDLVKGDGKIVDHINQNTLDNRSCNLRIVSHSLNQYNCKKKSNNTSGYRGVTWHEQRNKWMAQIVINKRHLYLGIFKEKENAAIAYDKAAIKHYNSDAILNFPERKDIYE
jgi:hypothetical protein